MNTERPDNDEASGGGDGSSAEARGAGAPGAEETRGSDVPGDERTSHAGADQDGGAEGAEEAGAAGGSAERIEEAADDSPASGTAAAAAADEPDGPAAPGAPADADTPQTPADGDSSATPSRTGLGKLPAPDAAAGPDEPVGLDTDHDQPQPPPRIPLSPGRAPTTITFPPLPTSPTPASPVPVGTAPPSSSPPSPLPSCWSGAVGRTSPPVPPEGPATARPPARRGTTLPHPSRSTATA